MPGELIHKEEPLVDFIPRKFFTLNQNIAEEVNKVNLHILRQLVDLVPELLGVNAYFKLPH